MTKALFRKQMLELFNVMFRQGVRNKNRSMTGAVIYAVLVIFVLTVLGRISYRIADVTCGTFVSAGTGDSYFAVMGLMATVFGVLASVFSIYTTLYQAKDNELLLSMPIPPRKILLIRLLASYLVCFVFEAVIMLPVYLVYWKTFHPGIGVIALDLLILFLLPVAALAICCLLGWILAIIAAHVTERVRNIVNFVLSFLFVVGFLNISIRAATYMQLLQQSPEKIHPVLRTVMIPFVRMGRASQGDLLSFLVFLLILAFLAALFYFLLANSFRNLATMKKAGRKAQYREKPLKKSSAETALFRKEFHRYRSSPSYFMNTSIGSILMLIVFVLILLNWKDLSNGIRQFRMVSETMPVLLGSVLLCVLVGTNTVSASSVSMEGKSLWFLQSSPLMMRSVLRQKRNLHLLVTWIPLFFCVAALLILMKAPWILSILFVVIIFGFGLLSAELGLTANLLFPRMDWVSESNAVRHSTSARISLLGSWALVLLAVILFHYLPDGFNATTFLLILAILILVASAGLHVWLMKKGIEVLRKVG